MRNPPGLLCSQEGPLAVVHLLKVLYLLQPPNLSWFRSQNRDMLTAEDLTFCYGQTQTILLPYDLFLTSVFGETAGTTILGFFVLIFDHKPSCSKVHVLRTSHSVGTTRAKLVRTQVVVRDCQDCEKSTWESLHAGRSIGGGTFLNVVYLLQPPSSSWFWP